MTYTAQVPAYRVDLPCGHQFRSQTPVVPLSLDLDQDEDYEHGIAWVPCRSCKTDFAFTAAELLETQKPPRDSAKRRISENRLAKLADDALLRDRVAEVLKTTGGIVPASVIAANAGVSVRTVERVAADLHLDLRRSDEPDDDLPMAA